MSTQPSISRAEQICYTSRVRPGQLCRFCSSQICFANVLSASLFIWRPIILFTLMILNSKLSISVSARRPEHSAPGPI